MERMSSAERPITPEKSRDELYFETLKSKRDVLSSHYTMNKLRKGRKVAEMSEADMEDYKLVKKEYDKRRESFLASLGNLSPEGDKNISELTSLSKVEIELSKLERPVETGAGVVAPAITPDSFGQPGVETPVSPQTPEQVVGETRIHPEGSANAEEFVSPDDAESPDRDTTMDEVDRMLKYSQDTARPLETAYWQSKKAELLERQEAEANSDRPAPRGFLQRVKDSFNRAKESFMGANRISGGSETVESRMSPLGLRKEAKESLSSGELSGSTQPKAVPQQEKVFAGEPRQEREPKKPSGWGWLKERGKGIWNFGIWEFHQAEKFRTKTKEAANDVKALATLIQQERNLSLEEAEKEAWETVEELKKNNLDISASEFYQANKDITERKKKENDDEVEYIIKNAGNDLVEKLAKYRGFSGEDVLTLENKLAFEADLRGELNKMRDGAMRKDFVNFSKLMRRNLDQGWWERYIWGATEAVWGFMGMMFITAKIEAVAAAKLLATEKAARVAGSGVEQFVTQAMNENVWSTLKEMAQQNGINLNPSELKELSQRVLDFNGMFEQEWVNSASEALRSSRTLPQGFPIQIPPDVMSLLGR